MILFNNLCEVAEAKRVIAVGESSERLRISLFLQMVPRVKLDHLVVIEIE